MEFLKSIGGVETLLLIAAAVGIALYLRHLSAREKKEAAAKAPVLDAARLAATADEELVDTVVRDLLDSCDRARQNAALPFSAPDLYRMTTSWSNPQVNVYSVWVAVKEAENGGIAAMKNSPSGVFFDLAADGFEAIGAQQSAAAFRAEEEAAFAAAVAEERPLSLCVAYIRDHADAFIKE